MNTLPCSCNVTFLPGQLWNPTVRANPEGSPCQDAVLLIRPAKSNVTYATNAVEDGSNMHIRVAMVSHWPAMLGRGSADHLATTLSLLSPTYQPMKHK